MSCKSHLTTPPTLHHRVPRRKAVALQQPASTRVRLPNSKHQRYISLAALVIKQLRSSDVQLPKALGILRQRNLYAFEELLLTCCHEQGWEIERNFKYTGDGSLDGLVTIALKLYLIRLFA